MKIERINPERIKDIQSAKEVIKELLDCIFELNRDISRRFDNISSQNIKTIDFNITRTENIDLLLSEYATKEYVSENYQTKSTS